VIAVGPTNNFADLGFFYGTSHNPPESGESIATYTDTFNPAQMSGTWSWSAQDMNGGTTGISLRQIGVYSTDLNPNVNV
jgi:hypothetical protein